MTIEKTRKTSIILFCFRCVPPSIRKLFFKSLLMLFYHAAAKHRLIALHNLRCAFPEKEMEELITIAKGVYRNVAAREGVFVDFFGRPACTGVGLAVLTLQSGASILPGFMA